MNMKKNIPLKDLTTMKIGGNALFVAEAYNINDVAEICHNAKEQNLPIFVIGEGSNIIAKDEGFNGIVVLMRIPGFEIIADNVSSTTIRVGAGELWDSIVKRTVDMQLSGIEAMSAIPGTSGATPIQNVGAYGQEIADTLQSLEAYDTETDEIITLQKNDCKFAYRYSIFRGESMGRYIVTSIIIKLRKKEMHPPFYDSLQKYFDNHNTKIFTPEVVRNAVIELRKNKLPDPRILPNSGSFFKNAVIDATQLSELRNANPEIPAYNVGNNHYKIPVGWLIEHSGLKGKLIHGIRIYDKNAMVLINESADSYDDLEKARNEITDQVRKTFHIQIEQEPLEI
jgi:UDP-N-acetylmuramate dehydrogenase